MILHSKLRTTVILCLTTGSPDWVNAIALSGTTLKEGAVLIVPASSPTESKLLNWLF
ncbi:MAG: hypothetical protein PUP90_08055 [Nostoc sp. S4]|nr:hypothetical protein [Nostoc sp. S4]